ncbi:hypothetical protein GALMADRAFT_248296 [Galerina marginata CBS 339.88]|uniref:DUF6533 domain-containing protein n=1 Tax=Galerina marginata (strain CBS 339.88) TaxID=685588 RepID=A0A067T023_GALM3|nr:hypothetical protein GALMADRAFT_248296 [Galerina marginata CBS 339.88]
MSSVSPSDAAAAATALLMELLKEGLIGPLVTYADVAASTVFAYDWLITLSMEIELIWRSRWNFIKILFLLQRYLPFLDTCFLELYRQLAFLTVKQCQRVPFYYGFLYITGFVLSEALLGIRVWALWNREKRLSILLPIVFVAIWVPIYYAMYKYVDSLKYAQEPFSGFRGCFIIEAKEYLIWAWVGLLLWNFVTLSLTLIHGIRSYRSGITSRLASVIYRDGAYYYLYLFIFSILNIFFTATLQPAKRVVLLSLERCLHSVFASRVLLHMRAQVKQPNIAGIEMGSGTGTGTQVQTIGSMKTQAQQVQSTNRDVVHVQSLSYEMKDLEKR